MIARPCRVDGDLSGPERPVAGTVSTGADQTHIERRELVVRRHAQALREALLEDRYRIENRRDPSLNRKWCGREQELIASMRFGSCG